MSRFNPRQVREHFERTVKANPTVRDLVRARRLRAGQPDWNGLRLSVPASSAEGDACILLATGGGGYLAATRVESLLALALAVRGASSHVLLCDGVQPACLECNSDWYPDVARFSREGPTERHCRACFEPAGNMFAGLGVRVHRYSDLLTAGQRRDAHEEAATVPLEEIPGYEVDGIRLGQHAMAGTLRFFARAELVRGTTSEAALRRYLEAALLTKHAVDRLFEDVPIDVAVSHHGIYVPQGVVNDVARKRGARIVNWHVAYRKRSFIFSHGDTYHHTLLSEPTAAWESMRWDGETERQIVDYLMSRWYGANDWIKFHDEPETRLSLVAAQTGIDFAKPCVGMLTNVMWDAQLHYEANAFPSMLHWATTTIDWFAGRPDLQLLIRVHPAEISGTLRSKQPFLEAIAERYSTLPPNVKVIPPESKLSTYAAMEACNAVLIYGTKTGIELAAVGIPVVVAGEAWVRNKGITLDADNVDGYLAILDRLPLPGRLNPEQVDRARRYAYHFFLRRMIPLEFAREVPGIPGFEFDVEDARWLRPGASGGLDVICDGILDGRPFVYPAEEFVGG